MRKVLLALLTCLSLISATAFAQFTPFTPGQILTAAELNNAFGATVTHQTGPLTLNYFVFGNGNGDLYAVPLTGLIKGNGTSAPTVAVPGTDYVSALTGPIGSVGNNTFITSQTGSGSIFVMNTSPFIYTPTFSGSFSLGTLGFSGSNILGSLQSNVNSYNQFIIQNSSSGAAASSDIVVSNNLGTDTTYYGDFGMNSSGFTGSGSLNLPNAVYLTSTTGDLVLGTTTSNGIHFVVNSGAGDAGAISSSGAWNFNSLQYSLTNASVSAAGTNQGTATVLTSTYNVVTTVASGAGVELPVPASPGTSVSIVNKGANALLVYPNSGGAIDAASTNVAISVPVNGIYTVRNSSTTQWYTFDPVLIGTANQITVTNTAGTTTISIPTNPTLGGANITGVPISTGVSGLGTGVAAALGTAIGSAGAPVVNGGVGGTPSSIVLTNATGTAASLTAGTATAANGINSATTTISCSSAAAPSSGQVLTATSSTTCNWASPTAILNGYINGFTLSNDGTSPNTVLDIAAGFATNSTNATSITGTAFTKQISGSSCTGSSNAFVVGTGNCGMDSTGVAVSTWYHVFAIICSGSYDVYFDTSVTAANKPACATSFRYVGSFVTNTSSQIIGFTQFGQYFKWSSTPTNLSGGTATTATAVTLLVPLGIVTHPRLVILVSQTTIGTGDGVNILGPTNAVGAIDCTAVGQVVSVQSAGYCQTTTNTSSQIFYINGASTTSTTIETSGYLNPHVAPNF